MAQTIQQWYVIHCEPLKERWAASVLRERLGLTAYLPEIRRRFRGQVRYAPLFPRYLFVQLDLQQVALSKINTTPGVVRLVSFDDMPVPIPASVIDALRERVDSLNSAGGLPQHNFHPGDTVRFTSGSLRGLEAVFVGPMRPSERVRVLIEFLGSLREAEVAVDLLEPAAPAAVAKRERRTRGKGRKIKFKESK